MSYLSNNFDAFQEGIINGGYDPQEQDNHPVRAAGDWFDFVDEYTEYEEEQNEVQGTSQRITSG